MKDARTPPWAIVLVLARFAILALACAAGAAAQDPEDERATIVGRFLLPDGEPAVGATVTIHGWRANQERVDRHGIPPNYKDPAPLETDEHGRFELSFVPPRAFQFTLTAAFNEHADARWRWSELEPGKRKDLGETTFEPAGVIEGSILDAAGNTLTGAWTVTARARRSGLRDGRSAPGANARPDAETGIFRIEGLPAGEVWVDAYGPNRARIDAEVFVVVAGGVTRVALEYEGPEVANEIRVTVVTRPFLRFESLAESIRLKAATGESRPASAVERRPREFRFDDVVPDEYEVEIVDPRFRPWRKAGVRSGDTVVARLEGSAGVRLALVDPAGEPVRQYGLAVDYPHLGSSPSGYELASDATKHEPVAYFGALVPDDLTLIARVDGWPPLEIAVDGLEPNETREITATLVRGHDLAGRVVAADGTPLAGVVVQHTKGTIAGHSLGPRASMNTNGRSIPWRDGETTTDAEGRFLLSDLGPGAWTVRARFSDWLVRDETLDVPASGVDELVLTSPPAGWLAGRVEIPEGASLDPLDLQLGGDDIPSGMSPHGIGPGPSITADGSFRFGPLPTGEVRLSLLFRVYHEDGSGWSSNNVEMGRFEIVDGETTDALVDLRETYPGRLRAHVRVDGEPGRHTQVVTGGPPGGPRKQGASSFPVDARGIAVIGGLHAGEWYLSVLAEDRSWCWERPEPVVVPVNGDVEVELDVRLAERRLRFLDDSNGEPLAMRRIGFRMSAGFGGGLGEVTTDGDGYATLVFCEGIVRFRDALSKEVQPTEVEWSVEGEGPGDVRLLVVPD